MQSWYTSISIYISLLNSLETKGIIIDTLGGVYK